MTLFLSLLAIGARPLGAPSGPALHDRVWLEVFSLHHAVVAGCFLLWIVGVLVVGLRMRALGREPAMRRTLAVLGVLFAVAYNAFWLTPPRFDVAESLPIHICDVSILLSALALWTNVRLVWALTYFFGVALSTQAFATPTEQAGPASAYFWAFWIAHTQIVGVALYLPVVLGYRPTIRDLGWVLGVGVAYTGSLFLLDASYGWDYAFVGPSERPPGVVALLGAWPLRALWVVLIASLACTLAWLPWAVARRMGAGWGSGCGWGSGAGRAPGSGVP